MTEPQESDGYNLEFSSFRLLPKVPRQAVIANGEDFGRSARAAWFALLEKRGGTTTGSFSCFRRAEREGLGCSG